jgi:hypothetical protein
MGWGSCEPPKPANEEIGVNPTLNAGSFALLGRSSSRFPSPPYYNKGVFSLVLYLYNIYILI